MRLFLSFFTSLLLLQITNTQAVNRARRYALHLDAVQEQSKNQAAELEEARELNQKVVRLYQEGKVDEALPIAKRVLQIRERALGKDHQLVIEALINLAELSLAQKSYRASLAFYERVLKSNEKLAGLDDPGNTVLLDKMAYLCYMSGDFRGAENYYKRSLSINEKISGGESDQVAQSAYNLAEFYRFTNNYQKAEPFYQRALGISDKTAARDDAKLLRTVDRYRCLFYQSDRMDKLKAFEETRRALYKSSDSGEPVNVINGKALSLPKPSYPQEARAARAVGIVVIRVTIDENGKVVNAEDMCGGNSWLVKAATEAAKSARFSQTLLSGQAVKVTGLITYKFAP